MGIEEVCDEGEIEFGVTGNEGCGGEELSAIETVGILKYLLCALEKISCL